jgi:N-formylglutamate deformylase
MPKHAYSVIRPSVLRSSVVFASPHSGRDYPDWFIRKSVLDEHTIRSSEDAFVDRLFSEAPDLGSPLLLAGAPRAFIDMNRGAAELDSAIIEGAAPNKHNPRVASGLGVIPRVVANGRAIYQGKLPYAEAERRIAKYWQPYHDRLGQLLADAREEFGEAILIDCHSMPHEAMDGVSQQGSRRPEIVLGDRYGGAAAQDIVDKVEAAFAGAGFVVTRNMPFAGAYVTQHYGRPSRRQHAIQIEIDRSLYMDENLIKPLSSFAEFQSVMSKVVSDIIDIGISDQSALAAE